MDIVLLMITLSISTYLTSAIYCRHRGKEILPALIVLCFLWQIIGVTVAYAFYYHKFYVMLNYPSWLHFFFVMILTGTLAAFYVYLRQKRYSNRTMLRTAGIFILALLLFYLVWVGHVSYRWLMAANLLVYAVALAIMFAKRDLRQSFLSFAQMGAGIAALGVSTALRDRYSLEYIMGITSGSVFIVALGAMLYYLEYNAYHIADITRFLKTERDASERLRKKYELVLDTVQEGIWEYDPAADRVFLSELLRDFFGVREAYVDSAFQLLVSHMYSEDLALLETQFTDLSMESLRRVIATHKPSPNGREYRLFSHTEQRYVWVVIRTKRVLEKETGQYHLYGTIRVTQNARDAEERIYQLAYCDQLTGLPNRSSFFERLEGCLKSGGERVLLLIDLDRFKYINDSRGHSFGNGVLCEVANRLAGLRELGLEIFRYGGTEFVLLADGAAFDAVSDALRQLFSNPVEVSGSSIHLTASVGYCFFAPEQLTSELLMIRLDLAKNKAKEQGGNCQVGYSSAYSDEIQERVLLSEALRASLGTGALRLFYQSKTAMRTGSVTGFEALLRWNLNGQWIPPDKIIRIAEETGQIHGLGQQIIAMAFQQQGLIGKDQTIAINLSVMQLEHKSFLDELQALEAQYGIDPGQFMFEITENVLMQGMDNVSAVLHTLRGRGYKISLDDFGTGYASYNYLSRLPIDELKLDRSLTQSVLRSDRDMAIVSHMIEIGKLLGFSVVCEGIEQEQEHEALKTLGCDVGQGYYYAMPMPADEILRQSAKL